MTDEERKRKRHEYYEKNKERFLAKQKEYSKNLSDEKKEKRLKYLKAYQNEYLKDYQKNYQKDYQKEYQSTEKSKNKHHDIYLKKVEEKRKRLHEVIDQAEHITVHEAAEQAGTTDGFVIKEMNIKYPVRTFDEVLEKKICKVNIK